ncbi:MAG: hypothetical protein JNM45_02850 [Rhizobiales bacterium]|nr:hypothetical protein [Hyphomicrobiales bacterium]
MAWSAEDKQQLEFLKTPVGTQDGGRIRYAAAMHFARTHRLSQDALEVFRILAKEDTANPRDALAHRNLASELDQLLNGTRP